MIEVLRNFLLATCLIFLVVTCPLAKELRQQNAPAAELVLSGTVKVNGKAVAPGFAIATGDKVSTAAKSSAVVSLGNLGRVEALPDSEMTITFDESSINIELDAGAVRVSKAEGMTATVSTKDGAVLANTPLAGSFTVDTACGNTVVTAHNVAVELRATGGEGRTVDPGKHDSVGKARPGCRPKKAKASTK